MNNLFFEQTYEKTAGTKKVSNRAADWGKEALNQFFSDFPMLSNAPARITFKEKDQDKGYGIGAINIGTYSLPVIIRDFQMFPFDVAISQDSVVPFTKETVQLLLSSKDAFSSLQKDESPDAFMRFFDTPFGTGPGTAMEKGGEWSVLARIEEKGLCSDGMKEKMASLLKDDMTLLSKVGKNNVLRDGLSKIAQMETPEELFSSEGMMKQAEPDIQYIYEDGQGTFTKLSGNTYLGQYSVKTGLEEHEIAGEPRILATESEKTASFSPKYMKTEGVVYKLANEESVLVNNEGAYRVLVGKDHSMVKRAGYSAGVVNDLVKLASVPSAGDTGFLFDPERGQVKTGIVDMIKVAFEPKSMSRISGAMYYDGKMCKFATLRGITDATLDKNTLYVPENWVFAKLGEEIPMSKLGEALDERIHNVEVVKCIGQDLYEFRGPVLRKYAERRDIYDCDRHKVAFSLLQCGAGIEDVTKIAELRPGESHVVKTALRLPYEMPEVEAYLSKFASQGTPNEDYLFDTAEVLKLAVELGAQTGVDAVLGTAFLKKDTLNRFIEMLPAFEDTLSSLAKLLLYVRMGADGLNEYEIKRTMDHMSAVVFQLHGVKNINKGK